MSDTKSQPQKILLCVTGGIAAYKSAEIIRRLQDSDCEVRVVMTENAEKFIGKITLQALSGHPVHQNMFVSDDRVMEHIDLARWCTKILIAPATANTIAKIASGISDDMVSALALASDRPIYVAPSMNQAMWSNVATQKNITTLRNNHIKILTPDAGSQACGETGKGRLKETQALVKELLSDTQLLAGKRVLITAGPTHEAIDPVRYIGNQSSGKMGYALAQQAYLNGASVSVVSGPSSLPQPTHITYNNVTTAEEMYSSVKKRIVDADIFISAAAVADYRPQKIENSKIKKDSDSLNIQLVKNPDILSEIAHANQDKFHVGFAAETENLASYATAKLKAKKIDMIVANQVGKTKQGDMIGFNSNLNEIIIITNDTTKHFPKNTKDFLAKEIISQIAENYEKKYSS